MIEVTRKGLVNAPPPATFDLQPDPTNDRAFEIELLTRALINAGRLAETTGKPATREICLYNVATLTRLIAKLRAA